MMNGFQLCSPATFTVLLVGSERRSEPDRFRHCQGLRVAFGCCGRSLTAPRGRPKVSNLAGDLWSAVSAGSETLAEHVPRPTWAAGRFDSWYYSNPAICFERSVLRERQRHDSTDSTCLAENDGLRTRMAGLAPVARGDGR
jgi:hypothetical protein